MFECPCVLVRCDEGMSLSQAWSSSWPLGGLEDDTAAAAILFGRLGHSWCTILWRIYSDRAFHRCTSAVLSFVNMKILYIFSLGDVLDGPADDAFFYGADSR